MLCVETSTSLGSLQKFEGAAGEFKGAHGSRHPLISSPVYYDLCLVLMNVYMFMVEIWIYCDPPKKFGRPKILQLLILGTQFLNPG